MKQPKFIEVDTPYVKTENKSINLDTGNQTIYLIWLHRMPEILMSKFYI